ncbi:MAG: FkbM family methyltransferase [Pyrinomonadaceae bacterium]
MPRRSNEFWAKLRWKFYLPEYFYRPRQIVRRVRRQLAGVIGKQTARLPWGADVQIQLPGLIPNSIWLKGTYDIVAAETIWRLIKPGEAALDVGANFGYFTSLMAVRCGAGGSVIAFEPQPQMHDELLANSRLWKDSRMASVEIHQKAISSRSGQGTLAMPRLWAENPGVAFVADESPEASEMDSVRIELKKLDDTLSAELKIGVAKFDIEGHELEAFKGADSILARHAIRDIVFEDSRDADSPAKKLLRKHGYTLFSLAKRFRGPLLCGIDGSGVSPRDDANFMATVDPARVISLMKPRGWMSLVEG